MVDLFRNGSFLRLFLGRIITNAGDSLYAVAAIWLIYELTGSSIYTGLAGALVFSTQSLQVFLGPLVDRWSLRQVLVGTQSIQLVGVLVVPIAAATGHLSVWLILALIPLLELLNQFVYPAQHAALPRIVEKNQLVRANSLFSFAYQGVDMVFNTVAGVLIALVGAVSLYVLDAVTFAFALFLFAGLSVPSAAEGDELDEGDIETDNGIAKSTDDDGAMGYVEELTEGYSYIRGSLVLWILLGAIVANFAYGMTMAVLPAFADTFGGPVVYGFLGAAMGAGSLVGAASASLIDEYPLGHITIIGDLLSAVCLFAALAVPGLWPTLVLFFVSFVPGGATGVMNSSLFQSAVDDDLLGRVMSVRNSTSTVLMPVGSLLGGVVAAELGSTMIVASLGIAWLFSAGYYLVLPSLRSLPPVPTADAATLGLNVTTTTAVTTNTEKEQHADTEPEVSDR
jgi:MFS family permease